MTKTIKTLQKEIALKLSQISPDENRIETKIILSHILDIKENELFLHSNESLSFSQKIKLNSFIKKRLKAIPVYKIIGEKFFYKNQFKTSKNVLDPRPETEILVDDILKNQSNKNEKFNILELGVGSGCVILSLLKELENAKGTGVDISTKALKIAKHNAKNLSVNNQISFINKSWNDLSKKDFSTMGQFDYIISNPPYIKTDDISTLQTEVKKYDPMLALDGGTDGLECYRDIASIISKNNLLKNGGKIYLEIGEGQESDIKKIFEKNNLKQIELIKDFDNIIRIMIFKK